MDVLSQRLHSQFSHDQASPKLEDYGELVRQLNRPREYRDVALTQGRGAYHFQHPTTESLNAENSERKLLSPRTRQIYTDSTDQTRRTSPLRNSATASMDDQQWHQNGQMSGASAAPDFQDDEMQAWFMNPQAYMADQHLDQAFAVPLSTQSGDLPFQQQGHPFWNSDVSGMAGFSIEDAQALGLASAAGVSGAGMSAPMMPTLNSPSINHNAEEAAAMAAFTREIQAGSVSEDGDPFGPNEQHHLVQQPMAIPGTDINQLSNVARLHAQAEQMMPSPSRHHAQPAHGPDTSPEGPQTFSQNSPTPSRSPSSIAESTDRLSDIVHMHQDSRRPSMTTDLTHNVSNIQLRHSQSSEDINEFHPMLFRKPSLPGASRSSTLAERRRQQTPNGLNVQRPHALNIGRTVSSSAINQIPNGSRYPTSPHGSLRRYKSSNVVLSGRVQKSAANSSRNSPMVGSFGDGVSVQSSQATPQPSALQTQSSLPLASPRQMADSHSEMIPPSASTATFTPGIHSGESMPFQSFQNTPVTTPYGFARHQGYGGPHVPPPSGIPQSAPAHVLRFDRPASPPGMPTMPNTPANCHFPQQMQPQSQMFNMPMQFHQMQQNMPIVPSQHGLPENMGFMPPQDPGFLHAGFPGGFHPHDAYAHFNMDPYAEHSLWARNQFVPKDLEVKFDAGCDRLSKEVAAGKATILPIEKRDFSFQNLSYGDMKKQMEKTEP